MFIYMEPTTIIQGQTNLPVTIDACGIYRAEKKLTLQNQSNVFYVAFINTSENCKIPNIL